jgi:hypothetical protein
VAAAIVIVVVAMSKSVFISHAGADSAQAAVVSQLLMEADIIARFDRKELQLGDSFLTFMETALSSADYCLLLWSRNGRELLGFRWNGRRRCLDQFARSGAFFSSDA